MRAGKVKPCFKNAALVIALASLPLLVGCGVLVTMDEVARSKSPDGKLVATVYEINGGATTDFAYSVVVSSTAPLRGSAQVADLYGAGRSECAYGVNLRWQGNDHLVVEYLDSERAEFKNANLSDQTVRVTARPGINDKGAPCGGMLYNLESQARAS